MLGWGSLNAKFVLCMEQIRNLNKTGFFISTIIPCKANMCTKSYFWSSKMLFKLLEDNGAEQGTKNFKKERARGRWLRVLWLYITSYNVFSMCFSINKTSLSNQHIRVESIVQVAACNSPTLGCFYKTSTHKTSNIQ